MDLFGFLVNNKTGERLVEKGFCQSDTDDCKSIILAVQNVNHVFGETAEIQTFTIFPTKSLKDDFYVFVSNLLLIKRDFASTTSNISNNSSSSEHSFCHLSSFIIIFHDQIAL